MKKKKTDPHDKYARAIMRQANKESRVELKHSQKKKKASAVKKQHQHNSKKYKNMYGVTQSGKSNILLDESRTAKPPGRRRSKSGNIYYEYRMNRSDIPGGRV